MLELPSGNRFLLWIDAVGGFLVCQGDEVVLGQAAPGNEVDVPILGDISRRHAIIKRRGGEYVIEPLQATFVDGHETCDTTLLSEGDEIRLGERVILKFRKPHALSASARLDFVSRHRTQPSADAIVLMAESCVLGPRWKNHIVCQDWQDDVVLYSQDADLYCRTVREIEVDGKICAGRGKISRNSRISGADFSLSLEAF